MTIATTEEQRQNLAEGAQLELEMLLAMERELLKVRAKQREYDELDRNGAVRSDQRLKHTAERKLLSQRSAGLLAAQQRIRKGIVEQVLFEGESAEEEAEARADFLAEPEP